MPRVDFYVLGSREAAARLRFACRLVEKAWLRDHRVRVQLDAADESAAFDDLLWTFAEGSFVPHERLHPGEVAPAASAPVVIADGEGAGPDDRDVLVNLGAGVPAAFQGYARIAEIVDADDERRRLGRERYRFYREHGIEPETHMDNPS
jgi:DNA polymerase-3 subunit chi